MSSSEEYLEKLLQSMMNGENMPNSNTSGRKSAIELLSGEEPEQIISRNKAEEKKTLSPEEVEAMFHPAGRKLDYDTNATMERPGDMPVDDLMSGITDKQNNFDDFSERSDSDSTANTGGDGDTYDLDNPDGLGDSMGLDDFAFEEQSSEDIPDEMVLEETIPDEMSLEVPDVPLEEPVMDEMSLGAPDVSLEEPVMDDISLGAPDMSLEEPVLDEMSLEAPDMSLEEPGMPLEEPGMDDMSLEASDTSLEEPVMDDMSLENFGMPPEEPGMDEMSLGAPDVPLEEPVMDDMSLENFGMPPEEPGMPLEEPGTDDMSIGTSDMPLGDLGLDDMDLGGDGETDMALGDTGLENTALGEAGQNDMLLDDLGMEEDLAEIGDLLKQSGQDDEVDEEMLALLSSISDSSGNTDDEEALAFLQNGSGVAEGGNDVDASGTNTGTAGDSGKEKKKEKKKKKKKRRFLFFGKGKESEDDVEDLDVDGLLSGADAELTGNIFASRNAGGTETSGDSGNAKKPGAFAKFVSLLTESDDDEYEADSANEGTLGKTSDENKELLKELSQEDKKNRKKDKKEKKKEKKAPKPKKSKKSKPKPEKKKPKPKKVKKVKEKVEEPREPEKKIPIKRVIPIILLCLTLIACTMILTSVIPGYLQKQDARKAYDEADYQNAYALLLGKNLSEEDELLMQKSKIILRLERKIDSFKGYRQFEKNLEALNALVEGCELYYELLPDAEEYDIAAELRVPYEEILAILSSEFGVSEATVMEILAYEDDAVYTEHLTAIVNGGSYSGAGVDEEWGEEEPEEVNTMPDVLPEEQEIIDNMPGLENLPSSDDTAVLDDTPVSDDTDTETE